MSTVRVNRESRVSVLVFRRGLFVCVCLARVDRGSSVRFKCGRVVGGLVCCLWRFCRVSSRSFEVVRGKGGGCRSFCDVFSREDSGVCQGQVGWLLVVKAWGCMRSVVAMTGVRFRVLWWRRWSLGLRVD